MRILGIDHGGKRIGLAICDPSETIASPLDVWPADQADAARFRDLVTAHGIEAVVVGLPVRTHGREGPEAAAVREFAQWLRSVLGLPVDLFDERFSTQAAQRHLVDARLSRRQRRDRIDKVTAQGILAAYLQRRRRGQSP